MGSGLQGSEGVRDSFAHSAAITFHSPQRTAASLLQDVLTRDTGQPMSSSYLSSKQRAVGKRRGVYSTVVVPEPFARPRVMPQPVRGHHDKHAALGGLTAKDGEHLEVARLEE